jgi:hypothetical protein
LVVADEVVLQGQKTEQEITVGGLGRHRDALRYGLWHGRETVPQLWPRAVEVGKVLKGGGSHENENNRPHVVIVCTNVPRPVKANSEKSRLGFQGRQQAQENKRCFLRLAL